ncbi:hypothetical protein RDABS01_014120 [Bienertia sinuspersici]
MESFFEKELFKEFHYIPFQIILVFLVFGRDKEYTDRVQNRLISFRLLVLAINTNKLLFQLSNIFLIEF